MLTTDDDAVADLARRLASQARLPARHYEHAEVGYNYRLSNLLAAVGRAQLSRLDAMSARRRAVREAYRGFIDDLPGVDLFAADDDEDDNCWLTSLVLDPALGPTPASVATALAAAGVETRPLWKPMHRQPAYASCASLVTGTADRLFATGLTLPSGSSLSEADLDRVLTLLSEALSPGA